MYFEYCKSVPFFQQCGSLFSNAWAVLTDKKFILYVLITNLFFTALSYITSSRLATGLHIAWGYVVDFAHRVIHRMDEQKIEKLQKENAALRLELKLCHERIRDLEKNLEQPGDTEEVVSPWFQFWGKNLVWIN